MAQQDDFRLRDHGSIVILEALTSYAEDWVREHLDEGAWNPDYPQRVIVEPRYVGPIVEGFSADGLSIEEG